MTSFHALHALLRRGMQPQQRLLWVCLDMTAHKRNAIAVSSAAIPGQAECSAVAGLDVIVLHRAASAAYGAVRRLCGNLYQAGPRRLQLLDMDTGRIAFLKVAR